MAAFSNFDLNMVRWRMILSPLDLYFRTPLAARGGRGWNKEGLEGQQKSPARSLTPPLDLAGPLQPWSRATGRAAQASPNLAIATSSFAKP